MLSSYFFCVSALFLMLFVPQVMYIIPIGPFWMQRFLFVIAASIVWYVMATHASDHGD